MASECRGAKQCLQGIGIVIGDRRAVPRRAQDAAEHITGFDRRQLVGIAQQDEARAIGDGVDQLGHQRQVDHRGFVDDDDIERQRVVGVVAEARTVGNRAEQAVQRGAGSGQCGEQRGIDVGCRERLHGLAHALGHALGGAAGGRGEGDTRCGAPGVQRLRGEQDEQTGDRRGLAGAGSAGHQDEAVAERDGGGAGLQVVAAAGIGKQLREQRRQRIRPADIRCVRADAAQTECECALVLAVAAQVEQAVFEHQRRVGAGFGVGGVGVRHPRRGLEIGAPGGRRRPVDVDVDQALRCGGIEPGMAVGDGERRQRGRREHPVGRGGIEPTQRLRECVVERAQRAGVAELLEQRHAARSTSRPANSASIASTSSGANRHACTPGASSRAASSPRQNR